MGSYRQLIGMMKSPERPQAIPPVPEEYEGTNYPYRGIESHGVAETPGVDPEEYYEHDKWDAGPAHPASLEAEKEPDPVKVKVVNETARERFAFRAFQFPANGLTAQQFLGRNDKRSVVKIKLVTGGSTNVIVGHDNGVKPTTGYIIQPGQETSIRTTEELFCIADKGGATDYVTFHVLEEVSVEL